MAGESGKYYASIYEISQLLAVFYLKSNPNKSGRHYIYLQFAYNGKVLRKGTGLSILPSDWDERKHLPRRHYKYYTQYKNILAKLEEAIRVTYLELIKDYVPTRDDLWTQAEKRMQVVKPLTLADYAESFAKDRLSGNYKIESIHVYRRAAQLIKEYDHTATFESIDVDWLEGFTRFLLKKKKLGQNTAAKLYQTTKTIINDATDKGINVNMRYKTRKVGIQRKETTKVFLDEAEIMKVYYAEMPNKEKAAARDIFVLSCLTGVRYSDIGKIDKKSLFSHNGIKYFSFVDMKTGGRSEVPAHELVLKILIHYDWKLPLISNQKYNEQIKEVCRIAGLNQPISVTSYPGGVRTDKTMPKYKLVSSHSARRSLICNLYASGVQVETIKKISGHRSHAAFLKYLLLTPSDHLKLAYKSEFYKEKFK